MRCKFLLLAGTFSFLSAAALAQTAAPAAPPPSDAARYVSAADIAALVAKQGGGLGVLSKGDKYIAEIARGGPDVEVHDHFGDLIIVLSGSATIVYGGTVSGNKEATPGEWRGGTMSGATTSVVLHAGDYLHIPAGMPHQSTIPAGSNYKMMLIKVAP